jgi:hypothetical protein
LAASCGAALAQTAPPDERDSLIQYPYAIGDTSFLNVTGQSVQVYKLPLSYTVRSLEGRRWGWKLLFPVSFGLHEFNARDAFGGELREKIGTVSMVPGAEFRVRLGKAWLLKPFLELGLGKDLEGGRVAYIYSGGLMAIRSVDRKKYHFRLGAGWEYDGSRLANSDVKSGFATLKAGLDVRRDLKKRFLRRDTDFSLYAIRRRFPGGLEFRQLDGTEVEMRNQNEVGVTFGVGRPFKKWLFNVDRVGIGYRFGGRLSSVRILFGVPF